MAGATAPNGGLADTASMLATLFGGSPKTTQTTEASPVANGDLQAVIDQANSNATNPAITQNIVNNIMRQAQIAFAPTLAAGKAAGVYNDETTGLLANQAVADATSRSAQSVLTYQTSQQQIADEASGKLAATNQTTTKSTAPVVPKNIGAALGIGAAGLGLLSNVGKLKKFLSDPQSSVEDALGISEANKQLAGGSALNPADENYGLTPADEEFSGGAPSSDAGAASAGDAFTPLDASPASNLDTVTGFTDASLDSANADNAALVTTGSSDVIPQAAGFDASGAELADSADAGVTAAAASPGVDLAAADITQPGAADIAAGASQSDLPGTAVADQITPSQIDSVIGVDADGNAIYADTLPGFSGQVGSGYASAGADASDAVVSGSEGLDAATGGITDLGEASGVDQFGNVIDAGADAAGGLTAAGGAADAALTAGAATGAELGASDAAVTAAASVGGDAAASFGIGDALTALAAVIGWIVCTELYKQGKLPTRWMIYGGRKFTSYPQHIKAGYYLWAISSTKHLRKYPNSKFSKLLEVFFWNRAEYIAAQSGCSGARKTVSGFVCTYSIYYFCKLLGLTIVPLLPRKLTDPSGVISHG